MFAGLGNADGLPAPLQILTESAPNPAVDALFLFSRTGDGDNIAGNCKTAAKLVEVQMLDAWGEDDIDVGKVAS